MINIKNIIKTFLAGYNREYTGKTAFQLLKDQAQANAAKAAGFEIEDVTVDRCTVICDSTGNWCEIYLHPHGAVGEDIYRCGMGWCCWVNVLTGEVVGISAADIRCGDGSGLIAEDAQSVELAKAA